MPGYHGNGVCVNILGFSLVVRGKVGKITYVHVHYDILLVGTQTVVAMATVTAILPPLYQGMATSCGVRPLFLKQYTLIYGLIIDQMIKASSTRPT